MEPHGAAAPGEEAGFAGGAHSASAAGQPAGKGGPAQPLWTRDFTIITLGSVVSMLGNSLAGFAMSLMVLDYTNSTLLYAIYMAMYTVPQLIMPIFSGAILDRFSRKKTIWMLDFLTGGIYLAVAWALSTGWFSFPLFALFCFVTGSIASVYMVAYDSFYPLLISEGNYAKAYSVASVLETLTSVMVPVSTLLYRIIGMAPLLALNGLCFVIAAVMETQIRAEEAYIEKQRAAAEADGGPQKGARRMLRDIREGFAYLRSEKGLLAIAVYFLFSSLVGGVSSVLTLPYFKRTFENGEFIYILVWGMSYLGRMLGGAWHYRHKLPARHRYKITLCVYVLLGLLEGVYLFLPVPVMMAFCLCIGLTSVTSYTIRISATQSYVPDEKKGRFNGAFQMLNTVGVLIGNAAAGALGDAVGPRLLLLIVELLGACAALVFIGGGQKHVAPIYEREA